MSIRRKNVIDPARGMCQLLDWHLKSSQQLLYGDLLGRISVYFGPWMKWATVLREVQKRHKIRRHISPGRWQGKQIMSRIVSNTAMIPYGHWYAWGHGEPSFKEINYSQDTQETSTTIDIYATVKLTYL